MLTLIMMKTLYLIFSWSSRAYGPLGDLRAGEVQQKYSRKENLNEEKKIHARPSYPKKIFMHLAEKIHLREMLPKKFMRL